MLQGRRRSGQLSRPVLLLVALSAAMPALASAGLGAAPLVRLVSPAGGAELEAGSLAVVAWEPAAGFAALAHAEEWEAFLSLDGGATYPLRITPHLDLSIRRFTFRVPKLPTRHARLLLRFGDERREIEHETPQRLAIVARAEPASSWPLSPRFAFTRGEAARTGDSGVVVWVEGSRQGGDLREVAAVDLRSSLDSAAPGGALFLALLWPTPARVGLGHPEGSETRLSRVAPEPLPGAVRSPALLIRLLIHRFNE